MQPGRARRDVFVLGGSAGALDALLLLLPELPATLEATAIVTIHLHPSHPSRLTEVLRRHSKVSVEAARHGADVVSGRLYVGVPDRHLGIDSEQLQVTRGPREHFTRPAIDVLFRSAARAYGDRVVGVLLSGTGQDGTLGLAAIKAAGGVTVAQDPALTSYPGMVKSAIETGNIDYILSPQDIGRLLRRLADGGRPEAAAAGATG